MSLRQGPAIGHVNHAEATAAGFVLPDSTKPAPAALALPATLDAVEPTGTFPSRTAAETRALTLMKKAKIGVSMFAVQIKGHWCIVRTARGSTEYVEG